MQSSSQASKARRFDVSRRTAASTGPKSHGSGFQKEDKNMNTIASSSQRRVTKGAAPSPKSRVGSQPRAPVVQSRINTQKQVSTVTRSVKPKPKTTRASTVSRILPKAAAPPPPALPTLLPLDPNCNEPSLPCLCCDGRSPQDNNSMFNHNHNNNNTISLRRQLQLPPPPAVIPPKQDGTNAKERASAQVKSHEDPPAHLVSKLANKANVEEDESPDVDNKKKLEEVEDDEESSKDITTDDENDSDDDEDDTLVPSCCDCPASLLEFSLTSSTSSSSTSISSCSDLESDSADQSTSICSFLDQEDLSSALSPKDNSFTQSPEFKLSSASSLSLSQNPFTLPTHSPIPLCSPDEGYPSALDSPSPDYLGVKEDSESSKLDLLDFLESVGEFGKMERFSLVIQVAHWDLEGEQHWDVLRDRLDHLDRLEKVNREVKLAYITRLHEKGFDIEELEEWDLSDVMDEMGNIDIPGKLYKKQSGTMGDSQEFSDAGVDLTAPSDCDDPLVSDSLTPSPVEPPPRPPKPPVRHASVSSELHTYINISREVSSMTFTTSPTLSTFSPNSSSPTFTTFRCEKPLPPSPPSIPPLPLSKPVSYLNLYTTPSQPPSILTPTPPIPPPRKRHLARKEAQRLAALQAEQEHTPFSLPPPTTRPPPLPPPPVISVTSPPPILAPPPALPPPPSFHALDVEIRKLLMLAGLTQAELLKLSPELGVCVTELDEEEERDNYSPKMLPDVQEFRLQGQMDENKPFDDQKVDTAEERRDTLKTTSFTEMARRRKMNTGLNTDHHVPAGFSKKQEASAKAMSFETFCYPPVLHDSPPPPPPPRPLPPIPSSVQPPKVSTLSANSEQPERFDWLIAFTPESEAPKQRPTPEKSKSTTEATAMQRSSSSSPGLGPKVTSFKELRFRNKNNSPPTKVITEPEPDPTVITPDPDILYNLKWRKEKAGSDGHQWEYTSQAQALFMQPPPALTSMAALKEMLQRVDEQGRHPELKQSPKMGGSVSVSIPWTVSQTKREDKPDSRDEKEKEEKVGLEVRRGRADGERSFESRSTVFSPPPSQAQFSQPYFLHSTLPPSRPTHYNSPLLIDLSNRRDVDKESIENHRNKKLDPEVRDDFLSLSSAGFDDSLVDFGADFSRHYEDIFKQDTHATYRVNKQGDSGSDSLCNLDSLYVADSETRRETRTDASFCGASVAPDCTTPYKNIDVIMTYSASIGAVESLHSQTRPRADPGIISTRTSKELPPLPTCYLYHPKNCPLHRGAPPRLSPIGALSPPQRSGASSLLNSPLFPRSHTLPALTAPLYYPNLYPPVPPPLPPKLRQGPQQPRVATVRSVSVQKTDAPWMGEDVQHPLRGLTLTSLCLQEKKALVNAVSAAVESILAQFSSSRTIVQKALSGDSAINPSLGRLVLQCLCPALHDLLTDGLKPHQSDVIVGRRPNSAWGLVQASMRTGPKTQALFKLHVRVNELPQLRRSEHKFNAFLIGLLNTKLLDFWLSHLHSCTDVLETCYHPTAFMRLSQTACRPHFDELLLVLQPLSLLTFNLDLLFQHHHLDADTHWLERHSSSFDGTRSQCSAQGGSNITGEEYIQSLSDVDFGSPEHPVSAKSSPSPKDEQSGGFLAKDHEPKKTLLGFGETSPQLFWVQEKEIEDLPPPNVEIDSFAQQAGQVIQQGWGAVMRWGGRLSQNLSDFSLSGVKREEAGGAGLNAHAPSDYSPVSSGAQVPWGLGRLFGAARSPNSLTGHSVQSRRPSQWLAPGVTALTRIVSNSTTPTVRRTPELVIEQESDSEKDADTVEMMEKEKPVRSVRMLCDHSGKGSELSFCKGEELVVLGAIDQDWIRCRQGDQEGLVPIGYTSLIM